MYFWDEHRGITRYYEILMSSVCEKYQLRQMEYDILMFLYNNPQHNTAADIVRYRKSTKSHVSTSLKVLEEKGLIERRIDKDNKKRVEIYILDSADDIIKDEVYKVENNQRRKVNITDLGSNHINLRQIYLTALARSRYNLYITNGYFGY